MMRKFLLCLAATRITEKQTLERCQKCMFRTLFSSFDAPLGRRCLLWGHVDHVAMIHIDWITIELM